MIRTARKISAVLILSGVCALPQPAATQTQTPDRGIVIAASVALDGRGRVLRNTRILIEGGRIVAVDPKAGPVDYDRRDLTAMPGWIDAHVHITSGFGGDGKFGGPATAGESNYQTAQDAWVTLPGGFTTVQTMSQAKALREAVAGGIQPTQPALVSGPG